MTSKELLQANLQLVGRIVARVPPPRPAGSGAQDFASEVVLALTDGD